MSEPFCSWHHTLTIEPWPGAGEGAVHVVQFDDPSTPVLLLRPSEAKRLADALMDAVASSDPGECPTACSEGHTYEPPCALAVSAPRGAGEPHGPGESGPVEEGEEG